MNLSTPLEKATLVARILAAYVEDTERKIAYGLASRRAALKQIKAGQTPTGYRAEWIRTTAQRVLKVLEDASDEFNVQFSWDKVSVADLGDVLATLNTHIQQPDLEITGDEPEGAASDQGQNPVDE